MFRFAHYVFGTENDQNVNNENLFNINDCVQTDIDDDWILIDVPLNDDKNENKENERNTNSNKEMQLIAANETTTYTVPDTNILDTLDAQNQHQQHPQSGPESGTPVHAMMEESWFVTPPPCFNSLSNPIIIETTPFENLLIEHPSMSVFGPSLPPINHFSLPSESLSNSSSTLSSTTDTSSNSSIALLTREQSRQTRRRRQQQQQNIQNRNNNQNQSNINLHLRAVVLDELHVLSSMQGQEVAQMQKLMTKSNMDRQNKTAFQRNRPQNRRAKMAMRPNGIYNNRKNC